MICPDVLNVRIILFGVRQAFKTKQKNTPKKNYSRDDRPIEDEPMYVADYSFMFVASLVSVGVVFSSLLVLGLGESGELLLGYIGLPFTRIFSWILLWTLPIQFTLFDFRAQPAYGMIPYQGYFIIPSLIGPKAHAEHAVKRGLAKRLEEGVSIWQADRSYQWVYFGQMYMRIVSLSIIPIWICIPIGGAEEYFGFVFIFGVGQFCVMMFLHGVCHVSQKIQPFLDEEHTGCAYSEGSGPATLGLIWIGFFFLGAGYSELQRRVSTPIIGLGLPVLLTTYEFVAIMFMERFYMKNYRNAPEPVRRLYNGTQQTMYFSFSILFVHMLAESARLVVMLCQVANDPESIAWMAVIPMSLFMQILTRTGFLWKFGYDYISEYFRLTVFFTTFNEAKYQGGYPRFFACAGIMLARKALGHTAYPSNTFLAVVIACLLEEIFEDVIVNFFLKSFTDRNLRYFQVKDSEKDSADADKLFLQNLSATTGKLPYLHHYCAVQISNMMFIVFLFFFGNGVPFVLGFCSETGYTGNGRGIIWWPKMDPNDPCGGL